MGEHELQRLIAEMLRPLLARLLTSQAKVGHVGADTFVYWAEGEPGKRVAPDVYVLPGIEQGLAVPSWRLWEIGVKPSFVFEVVSSDALKDYEDAPVLYGEIGVGELVVFDPHARIAQGETNEGRRRVRWQVFRRVKGRGFVRVESSQGDRIASRSLGCFLRVVGEGAAMRVRVGLGPAGEELFPTEAEAERATAEAERGRAEAERGRADAAVARVAQLEAELAKARAKKKQGTKAKG